MRQNSSVSDHSARAGQEDAVSAPVPAWCAYSMEGSVYLAISIGVLLGGTLGYPVVAMLSLIFALFGAVFWILHIPYLGWFPILRSWPAWTGVLGGVVGAALLVNGTSVQPGPSFALLGACVLIFAVVSGGFTEKQVARLMWLMLLLGVVHVVIGLWLSGVEAEPGGDWHAVTLLNSCPVTAAFMALSMIAGAANCAYSAEVVAIERDPRSMHSSIAWFTSPGAQSALLGIAGIVFVMFFLALLPSIAALPLAALLVLGTVIGLACCSNTRSVIVPVSLLCVTALVIFSLGRGAGERTNFSDKAFDRNISHLLAGEDARYGGKDRSAETVGEGSREEGTGEASGRILAIESSDLSSLMADPAGRAAAVLGALMVIICGIIAAGTMLGAPPGAPPILAVAGLFGLLTVVVFAALTSVLSHPAIALSVPIFLATAAAGGTFDEEGVEG